MIEKIGHINKDIGNAYYEQGNSRNEKYYIKTKNKIFKVLNIIKKIIEKT